MTDPHSDEIDEDLWNEASGRADAIRRFLKENPGRKTSADIARLARELDLSRASVFRLIKLFREGGTVMSLVERKRGRPVGHRTLDAAREEIIHAAINGHYLKRTRPSISQLVRDVQTDCLSAGLKPPHRRTIVARLEDVDLRKRARRRGERNVEKAATAVPGTFSPARPLDVVQIDHTRADVFVVDEDIGSLQRNRYSDAPTAISAPPLPNRSCEASCRDGGSPVPIAAGRFGTWPNATVAVPSTNIVQPLFVERSCSTMMQNATSKPGRHRWKLPASC